MTAGTAAATLPGPDLSEPARAAVTAQLAAAATEPDRTGALGEGDA